MKRRTFDEWKEFLGLGEDAKLIGNDFANEVNYLQNWEWGEGVDERYAIIGGAVVLSTISKQFEVYVTSGDETNVLVIKARLFEDGGFMKDFDLRKALLTWADHDFASEEEIQALRAVCVEVIAFLDAGEKVK